MKDYTNAIEGPFKEVLEQLKNDYIKVDCAFHAEKEEIKTGAEWLDYFQELDNETLTINAIATPTESPFNYYNYDVETFEG